MLLPFSSSLFCFVFFHLLIAKKLKEMTMTLCGLTVTQSLDSFDECYPASSELQGPVREGEKKKKV